MSDSVVQSHNTPISLNRIYYRVYIYITYISNDILRSDFGGSGIVLTLSAYLYTNHQHLNSAVRLLTPIQCSSVVEIGGYLLSLMVQPILPFALTYFEYHYS